MSTVPAKVLNDLFFGKVGSAEGKDKIAEFGGTYIRDRLREVSFARKIVPPTPVQRSELQRSVNHDTLVKIVDIEPNSPRIPKEKGSMGERFGHPRPIPLAHILPMSEEMSMLSADPAFGMSLIHARVME